MAASRSSPNRARSTNPILRNPDNSGRINIRRTTAEISLRNSGSNSTRESIQKSLRASFDQQKENEGDTNYPKTLRARSSSKGAKNFMAPTISASSKSAAASPLKIFGERNRVISDSNSGDKGFSGAKIETANLSFKGMVGMEEIRSKPEMGSGLHQLLGSGESRNMDPEIKNLAGVPPVLPSPEIAPSDGNLSLPPYDPKINYLSPRPQFLHYKPNPRFSHRINMEGRFDEIAEDSFSSESYDDSSESTEDAQSSPLRQQEFEEEFSPTKVEKIHISQPEFKFNPSEKESEEEEESSPTKVEVAHISEPEFKSKPSEKESEEEESLPTKVEVSHISEPEFKSKHEKEFEEEESSPTKFEVTHISDEPEFKSKDSEKEFEEEESSSTKFEVSHISDEPEFKSKDSEKESEEEEASPTKVEVTHISDEPEFKSKLSEKESEEDYGRVEIARVPENDCNPISKEFEEEVTHISGSESKSKPLDTEELEEECTRMELHRVSQSKSESETTDRRGNSWSIRRFRLLLPLFVLIAICLSAPIMDTFVISSSPSLLKDLTSENNIAVLHLKRLAQRSEQWSANSISYLMSVFSIRRELGSLYLNSSAISVEDQIFDSGFIFSSAKPNLDHSETEIHHSEDTEEADNTYYGPEKVGMNGLEALKENTSVYEIENKKVEVPRDDIIEEDGSEYKVEKLVKKDDIDIEKVTKDRSHETLNIDEVEIKVKAEETEIQESPLVCEPLNIEEMVVVIRKEEAEVDVIKEGRRPEADEDVLNVIKDCIHESLNVEGVSEEHEDDVSPIEYEFETDANAKETELRESPSVLELVDIEEESPSVLELLDIEEEMVVVARKEEAENFSQDLMVGPMNLDKQEGSQSEASEEHRNSGGLTLQPFLDVDSDDKLSLQSIAGLSSAAVMLAMIIVFLYRKQRQAKEQIAVSGGSENCSNADEEVNKLSPGWQRMMRKTGKGEETTSSSNKDRRARRESTTVSSSSFISYGSFTSYEKPSAAKKGCRDENSATPVRRSSRIRNQFTSST